MLRSVLGPDVEYGPTCSSGPLGGDAQCGQQIILEDLGGVIFFTDPLSPHPHAADIATLLRMCDIANVLHATNPTTAKALIPILRRVSHGEAFLVPSMTETLHCPQSIDPNGSTALITTATKSAAIAGFLGATAALALVMATKALVAK